MILKLGNTEPLPACQDSVQNLDHRSTALLFVPTLAVVSNLRVIHYSLEPMLLEQRPQSFDEIARRVNHSHFTLILTLNSEEARTLVDASSRVGDSAAEACHNVSGFDPLLPFGQCALRSVMVEPLT